MKKNIYFCESYNQIPIAIYLNKLLIDLTVYTRHEIFVDILKDFNIKSKTYDLIDFNKINNPSIFIIKYLFFFTQIFIFLVKNRNSNIYTSSATGNVGLFLLYRMVRLLGGNVTFVWWNKNENLNGETLKLSDFIKNKVFFMKKYIRLIIYKCLIFHGVKLKKFNGEIFFSIEKKYFNKILISDNRHIYSDLFYSKYRRDRFDLHNKIIFICGGYDIYQEFDYFNKEKVLKVYNFLKKYKEFLIFKTHPSGRGRDYFLGTEFNFYILNEVLPIEAIASESNLILSFGSSSIKNLAELNLIVYCLNKIDGYSDGLISNEFTSYYCKPTTNIKNLSSLSSLESLINNFLSNLHLSL